MKRSVARNGAWGIVGFIIPTILLLAAYSVLVRRLGADAFGIFALVNAIVGTMTVLDFGLSAAATRFIAVARGADDSARIGEIVAASFLFYAVITVVITGVIWASTPWLVHVLHIRSQDEATARFALRLASIQFPLFLIVNFVASVFKAYEDFLVSTAALAGLSVLSYGGALVGVLGFGLGLRGVFAIMLAANLAVAVAGTFFLIASLRSRGVRVRVGKSPLATLKSMASFGGASAVHSISAFFFTGFPRVVVSNLFGTAAVATYTLPFSLASRVHQVIASGTEVLFPMVARRTARGETVSHLYTRGLLFAGLAGLAMLLPMALWPHLPLVLWVGEPQATLAAPVLRIFAVSFCAVVLTPIAHYFLNGVGRPWINAGLQVFSMAVAIALLAIFFANGRELSDVAYAVAGANVAFSVLFVYIGSRVFAGSRSHLLAGAANAHVQVAE